MSTIEMAPGTATELASVETTSQDVEDLAGRLFIETVGALHLASVYVGVRHNLFKEVDDHGPLTADELAKRTGLDRRYLSEWLRAEAVAGLLRTDDVDPLVGRFWSGPAIAEVLVDETGQAYSGSLPALLTAGFGVLPTLVDAFRSGDGVPYPAYGEEAVSAQSAMTRPAYQNDLIPDWISMMPGVADLLGDTARPALVADIGCGTGWAAIRLALAYPHLRVDGFDTDETSIAAARRNAAESGVADRVSFDVVDSGDDYGQARYDVVFFFECLHDMAQPVAALRQARAAVTERGSVIVMDEAVTEDLGVGDPLQSLFASCSLIWCTPQGLVEPGSQVVGTVMRPQRMAELAREAGWSGTEDLPIEHPFWRFYELVR